MVRGLGGPDELYGNAGKDRVVGGRGEDLMYGGYGADRLDSHDLDAGGIGDRDVLDCGPGHDTVEADFEDRICGTARKEASAGFLENPPTLVPLTPRLVLRRSAARQSSPTTWNG